MSGRWWAELGRDAAKQYRGLGEVFRRYWHAYGGWRAFVCSPYLHSAIVLSVIMAPRWLSADWPADVIAIVPGILGFSLGGYAILLAFGDERFLGALATEGDELSKSYFMAINVSFVHFILLQLIALLLALVGQSFSLDEMNVVKAVFSFVAYSAFVYSLFTAMMATIAIFRLAFVYGIFRRTSGDSTTAVRRDQSDDVRPS